MSDGLYYDDPISCDICGRFEKHDDTCPQRSLDVTRTNRYLNDLHRQKEAS